MSRPSRPPHVTAAEDAGPSTPIERRQAALGVRLRSLRAGAGLDQKALAARLGITHSMVSKYEGGRKTPSTTMLDRIAAALDLSPAARAELVDQVGELAVEVNTLRLLRRRGDRAIQQMVADREAATSAIASYHSAIVPGLLQTPEYTAAMLAVMAPQADPDEVIAGRRDRQRILYDESKRFRFLLTEAALRTRVAAASVLRAQLRRILALDEGFDHIEIRVIPTGAPLRSWALTGFDITGEVVEVELHTSQVVVHELPEVAEYLELFESLWPQGVAAAEMAALVRRVDRWLAGLGEQ